MSPLRYTLYILFVKISNSLPSMRTTSGLYKKIVVIQSTRVVVSNVVTEIALACESRLSQFLANSVECFFESGIEKLASKWQQFIVQNRVYLI